MQASLIVILLATALSAAQSQVSVPGSGSPPARIFEDFSTPSLDGSQLHPDTPETVETTDEATYIREWVAVQWRPNDLIYLFVVRPKNVPKPPFVIYLYSFPSETDLFRDDDWCQRTTAGGYAAVGFLPALTGHRYHDRSVREWFVSELQESLATSAHDVQMVLNYLNARSDLDMDRVGIFGEGAGATIALMSASADPRIKAVDLRNPWGDWPAWMAHSKMIPDEERQTYLQPEFLRKVAAFDPVSLLSKLTTTYIRLIQTDDDPATPAEAKNRIATARPAKAEYHHFRTLKEFEGSLEFNGDGFDWLKLQLKPPEPSRVRTNPSGAQAKQK